MRWACLRNSWSLPFAMASIGGGISAEGAKSQSETFTTRLLIDALSIALSRTFTTCHLIAASISSGVIRVHQLCCLAGHWGMIPNFSGLRPRLETGPCSRGLLEDSGDRQQWQHMVNSPTAKRASAQQLRREEQNGRRQKHVRRPGCNGCLQIGRNLINN